MLDGEKLSSQNHINFFCFLSWNYITFNKKKHKYEIDFQKKNCFGLYFFGKEVKYTQYIYYEFVHLTFEV